MIIDQWYTSHIDKINEAIVIIHGKDDKFDVEINGQVMATLDDLPTAEALVLKLENFIDRYRRSVDTFDIAKEIELIKKNKNHKQCFGSYFS